MSDLDTPQVQEDGIVLHPRQGKPLLFILVSTIEENLEGLHLNAHCRPLPLGNVSSKAVHRPGLLPPPLSLSPSSKLVLPPKYVLSRLQEWTTIIRTWSLLNLMRLLELLNSITMRQPLSSIQALGLLKYVYMILHKRREVMLTQTIGHS